MMDMRARLDAWKEKKRKLEVETTSKIQEGGRRVKRAVMSALPTRTVQPRSISASIVHTSKLPQPKVVVSRSNSSQQASNPSLPSRVEVARRSKNGHLESPPVNPTPDKHLTHSSSSISSDIPNATDEHQASPHTSAQELKKTASMTNLGAPLRILNKKRMSNEVLLDKFDSPTQPPRRVSMGDPPSTAKKPKENRRASYEGTPSKRRSSLSSGPLRVLANQSESDSDDDIMPDQPTDRRRSSTLQALRVRTSTSRLSTSSLRTSIEPVERDKTAKWSRDDFKSIEKKLGFGKFGYVYLTKQKTVAEKEVALKVLTKNNMDEVRVRGLKMEVEIQSRLKHPHILRLYRYFHEEALAYLVLEYAPHGTLQKLLEEQSEGYFPEDKAAKFVAQVAKALQYLHARHVIHRDIKPENLLLGSEHDIKVADFGLAIHVPPPNRHRHHFCGTPEYMSPEVIREREYSCEVDLWSLGIVAYELLVGQTPFRGEDVLTNIETWYDEKLQNPSLLVPGLDKHSHISDEARELIQGLVAPSESRWSLEQALQHSWLASRL